jgi:Protein of unknown function (DUF3237)
VGASRVGAGAAPVGALVVAGPGWAQARAARGGRDDAAMTPTPLPAPQLRHVFRLDADLGTPLDVGAIAEGRRRVVGLLSGRADGPDGFSAELLPTGAADWQLVRSSGTAVADLRYILQTESGSLLYVKAHGTRHGAPEVLAALAAGEHVDPDSYTFRTWLEIETADPKLAWMNDSVFIAVGGRWPAGVSYDVYVVE